jgi:alkanesulfonate monooxygenase SsuD/methylene tetrahydromethanopterin reductase-like flavin-dependent oxidoreductase (luciferase family)
MQQKQDISAERSVRDRVGVTLSPTKTVEAIAWIREAEQAGVRQIWTGDAYLADTLTLFAIAAAQTERIRLGTAIVSTYPRHPLVMARQALAVQDVAPGRLRLGIGPGGRIAVEDWYGLTLTSPLHYLKDYVQALRSILWEGNTSYQSQFFKIALPMPHIAQVPLFISALGPKAFRLAGEIAGGALPWMSPIPYLLQVALPAMRAGAEASNRSTPPLVAHVLVALSTDEAAVLAAARSRVQMYGRVGVYAHMFAQAGFAGAANGDEQSIDALARTLVIYGDEASVRGRVLELLASGLDEIQLQLIPIADEGEERQRLLRLVGSL